MTPKDKSATLPFTPPPEVDDDRVVGLDCQMLLGVDGPMPMTSVTHLSFKDLTPEDLVSLRPALIILPLFAAGYDAITAIEALESFGYVGRITVLAPALPKPRLVERELRALGPGDRLTLISP